MKAPDSPSPPTPKSTGGVVLSVAFGVFVGIGVYTFLYAKGLSYLSTDPAACANCHVMREQYSGWQKASHHNVAVCADCHMPHSLLGKYYIKAENGFLHSLKFTLQNFPDQIMIRESSKRVLNNACLHCHGPLAGHIRDDGKNSEAGFCTRCHSGVGH